MSEVILKQLLKKTEIIISLLGRSVFPESEVLKIVRRKKRNPEKYIQGYNACDGTNTVTEIARIVGVTQPNMSDILSKWEDLGIIYEVEKPQGKFYKHLFHLSTQQIRSGQ